MIVPSDPVRTLASYFLGWKYGRTPDVPFPVGSYPSGFVNSGTKEIDCSSLNAWIAMALFPGAPWKTRHYEMLQVYYPDQLWSAIECLLELGIGAEETEIKPGSWYYFQRWHEGSGHQGLISEWSKTEVLQLDSTKSKEYDGPRFLVYGKEKALKNARIVRLFV